nr:immunoglobulin light chain junction region [Mus musculus]
CQQFSGYPWTF